MSDIAVSILLGVLGSSAFCELVRYFIGRASTEKQLKKLEKDVVRNQLMTLIHDYPKREEEIMQVANHYFVDLNGNWFATGLFEEWLEENNVKRPTWFKG